MVERRIRSVVGWLLPVAVIVGGCGEDGGEGSGAGASQGSGASGAGASSGAGPAGPSGSGASGIGGDGANAGTGGEAGSGSGTGGFGNDLLAVDSFHFEGAFRVPADDFGASSVNYAVGPIAHNPQNASLFIVGHAQQNHIAEFVVPPLVDSTTLADLQMADPPLQGFDQVLGDVPGGNPQEIGVVGGMLWVDGATPQLIVNGYEYYDAPADNSHTTMVVRDANDLSGAAKDGWFEIDGAAHASGWMSPIPEQHQAALGGAFITGHSSGVPIISRLSVGPSAFVFDPAALTGAAASGPVAATAVLDFSLQSPLHADLSNDSGDNKLWTHLSRAVYGFIVPGTRTYVTLGRSGGHETGVCYKCTPVGAGADCGGYCANDVSDYANYYWFWDVDDLAAVKSGAMQPHEVAPYAYGAFPTPFGGDLGGGAYDAASGLLYLTLLGGDDEQGTYAVPPLVVVYSIR